MSSFSEIETGTCAVRKPFLTFVSIAGVPPDQVRGKTPPHIGSSLEGRNKPSALRLHLAENKRSP